ncbi:MAG: SDR family NAD(P)-dependent oxidoreductase [Ignavibacteriae bacterium]|nr:SDR family NAD(P)-dependent oxidoreductase [Ignavibacteriota bacterium]NOG99492.1 SDR family NAD(P)-dependent oxidoreductase [Ignavibacteriota bacterium]
MKKKAIIIGNTDGIGLAITNKLLEDGWIVVGISKSESEIKNPLYIHIVSDVKEKKFSEELKIAAERIDPIDVCIYCAGIGGLLNTNKMGKEADVINVNLTGLVKTASCVIPLMTASGKGHFIGISSVADVMISSEAPSYNASKAGFSNYMLGLAKAVKPKNVNVTNVRFGFVDTKMAKGNKKPFIISVEKAVEHLLKCIDKKPVQFTAPWFVHPLTLAAGWISKIK